MGLEVGVVALGIFLIVAAFQPEVIQHVTKFLFNSLVGDPERIHSPDFQLQLQANRTICGAIGAVLALIPLTMLLRWIALRRFAREISYTTELGTVSVSLVAIEEALTRAVEQAEGVKKVQLRLFEDRVKRMLVIEAVLTLWDDGDVTSVNRRCQNLIRRRFAELMPEQTAVQVHLSVHRLNARKVDPARTATIVLPEPVASDAAPAAPAGGTSRQATELLPAAAGRRSTGAGESEAAAIQSAPPPGRRDTSDDERQMEDEYANLYQGPTYPVEDSDDADQDDHDPAAETERRRPR